MAWTIKDEGVDEYYGEWYGVYDENGVVQFSVTSKADARRIVAMREALHKIAAVKVGALSGVPTMPPEWMIQTAQDALDNGDAHATDR